MRAQGRPIPDELRQEWVVILDGSTPAIVGAALDAGFGDDRLEPHGVSSDGVDLGRYAFVFCNHR